MGIGGTGVPRIIGVACDWTIRIVTVHRIVIGVDMPVPTCGRLEVRRCKATAIRCPEPPIIGIVVALICAINTVVTRAAVEPARREVVRRQLLYAIGGDATTCRLSTSRSTKPET